jgi:DNA repair protein RadC
MSGRGRCSSVSALPIAGCAFRAPVGLTVTKRISAKTEGWSPEDHERAFGPWASVKLPDGSLRDAAPVLRSDRQASLRQQALVGGVDTLGDADLLSIILGTGGGGAPLAALSGTLLEEHGGVGGLLRASVGQLAEHRGIGPAKAARLAAALELGRRAVQVATLDASPRLPDGEAVVRWARPRLATLDHEELWVLALDGRHGLRAARRVASGGIHGLHVGVRDVLRVALREAASAIILVHNHPSGDATPSDEDVAFTKAVAEGATVVGTPLIDHVVIARQRASSMLDLGLMPTGLRRGRQTG